MQDLSKLEPLIGIRSWFARQRPSAILARPYGFIVYEEPDIQQGGCTLSLLHKKCVDTINAIRSLPIRATYAGLKDSEAFTVQYVSTRRMPDVIASYDVILAPIYTEGCLERGDVRLNHFSVTLITRNCKRIKLAPNFYGFQRFGTRRPNSHVIGKLLLLEDYAAAYEELVMNRYPYEGKSLGSYEKHTQDYIATRHTLAGMHRSIPKVIAEISINAYQAYLFNLILSKLVENIGSDVCTRYPRLPVPGCGIKKLLGNDSLHEMYQLVFEREGITESDFCRAKRFGIHAYAFYRETCVKPAYSICFEAGEIAGEKLYTLMFALPRGSYATIWLASGYRLLEPYPDLMPCKLA